MSIGKRTAGYRAAEYVQSGMIVGFGTGSTADYFTEGVAIRLRSGEISDIVGVPTSRRTAELMAEYDIPVVSLDSVHQIDLLVDGADEATPEFYGTKGGGGALLHEKIVAQYSNDIIWIVTPEKLVDKLGAFPLPIEVIQFGSWSLFHRLEAAGYQPAFRKSGEDSLFHTDSGNYIIDLHLNEIEDPRALSNDLMKLVGVVETGLFLDYAQKIIVGDDSGNYREIEK